MPSKNLPKKSINDNDFFLISDLAELLHVSTHTIRNLERDFSIEVKKDVNGKRVYVFSDVEKYRKLIDKKSEFEHSVSASTTSEAQNTKIIQNVKTPAIDTTPSKIQIFSNVKLNIINKIHSLSYTFRTICKFSLAMFFIVSFTSYGSFLLDKYLDMPVNLLGNGDNLYSRNNVSNVLQSTDENWEYRFDVNIPAYFNSTLFSSEASIDLIRVGTNVTITPEGVFAPNVINSINTLAGESLLLVDITDPNNPILSVQENPSFATLEIESLTGVTEIDDVTIGTIEGLLNIPAGGTDAQTLEGLASADFLRSNANTTYTNGIMTFDASSSLKFNNLNPNTFLRVDSNNNLTGFDIVAGSNVNFTTTANSLIINVNAIATSSQSSSVAVGSLFLGGTTFDTNYLILASAQEINKLYTLSGNIITSSNFSSTLLSSFVNIDTDATNDITTSNLTSSILSSFPNIDTDATNDVLISSLAALMLSNYPNLDTNALDDVDLLQDAVLVTTGSAKNVYSINTWFGYQNFSNISGSLIEVEENGKLVLNPGVLPSDTNNSLYNYGDRLYFEELPLIQVASHVVSDHANKFAFFTTDASNRLLLTGSSTINLSNLQTGASSSILGMDGSTLRYLSVGGDLSVSTTSSSTITFTLNNVNSTTGTFGGSFAVPVITVNSKGQVTSITTTPFNDYYTSNISFSIPSSGSRTLRLQQNGLADLTSTFTLLPSDITSALGYIPLRNTTDSLTGNLGVSGNFSAASASFNSIALSNALSVNYGGTGLTQTPANGQLIIGNAGGYSLSSLISGTNINIVTGPGSITISSTDTTNPNNYVTAISFSTPEASQRILTLTREGLSNLTAAFSLSSSDITSALGYTPLKNTTDTLTGNLGVSGSFSASLGSFSTLNATNSSIGTLTLTNALGIIYGGTGLTQT
ncbi:MerR family transcriptional regulator, partial [bacterium]|nr:MerR family transcriptional regulator [bacterium]